MATGELAKAVDDTAKKPEATPVPDNPKGEGASKTDEDKNKPNEELAKWLTRIFITSCVFGVLLDPLFLYIPLINQDLKCLRLDNTIKIIALVSRSFTDLFYVGRIILQVCRFENWSASIRKFLDPKRSSCKLRTLLIERFRELLPEVHKVRILTKDYPKLTKEIWESSILVDILAILPLPQVAILIFFPKMRVSGSFAKRVINFVVMGQYVPRVLRIYLSCKKAQKPFKGYTPLWIKGLLNLFLFILASHVLGAFWYFFAAEQMINCWKHACQYENGCVATTFDCHEDQTLRNITALNNLCPTDPPNTTLFDFGIYLNALQSGALWSTDYPLKFLNSFCWGLRNLSSFGSNLQPSFYIWEIAFAAFISLIGLILFVYLIGNLQTYVLIGTESVESLRREKRLAEKIEQKGKEVEAWLSHHGLPLSRKQKIMETIKSDLQENSDFDVDRKIWYILESGDIERYYSPLPPLRNVPLLKDMDEEVLAEIYGKLKPNGYDPGTIIIKKDETDKMMLFILVGRVTIRKTDGSSRELGAGKFYGEELLVSSLWTSSEDETVLAIDHVQALVLFAEDMESISSKARKHLDKLRMVIMLQKVPKLQTMDEQVLRAMSELHREKRYKRNDYIVREGQPLKMMFFVTSGHVTRNKNHPEANFFGEELVEHVLDESFPDKLPASTCTVKVESNDARVLILKADSKLKKVASKFNSHFSAV